ncbi:uncharacterized protein DUF1573 [Halospina denitrificans]|uniref:Uncharacterized protein DUF1573 n=1 Tax=Halospina denitrificans TaxID=332522 RepID=A0A4R7JVN6_9GAMM|nr:choice-of-anchor D domain-containing protein [Halospina denitrificans]TDT41493.1 uncharacterized protein DUF1573 [Halospina denitrificans]
MSSIKNKPSQQKQRLVLSTAVAAVLAAGATSANAEEVSVTVEHTCPLPLIGDTVLTSEVSTNLPATLEIGEATGEIPIDVVTSIPNNARQGLSLAGGRTLEGTATASNTISLTNEDDRQLSAVLDIPQQPIPEESGSFTVDASGTVESQTFNEPGEGEINVGGLVLEQQVRDGNGDLVGDPVGEFTADCTLNADSDTLLHTFVVEDDGGPVEDPASIDVEPQELAYGETAPGDSQSDRTQSVAVSNTGDLDLGINNVTIQGNDADAFNQTNDCSSVAGGESCGVDVTYTPDPTLDRDQTATLVIESTDEENATVEVPLSGTPIPEPQPEITLDPESIDFGNINIDEAEGVVTRELEVGNRGGASLNISGVQVSGDNAFSQTNDCSSLETDSSCSVSVQFDPAAGVGDYSGTLTITNSDEDQEVPLSASVVESDDGVEVDYDLVGDTIVSASDALVELTGEILSTVDLGSGDVTADLSLDPTTTEFEIIKLFSTIKGRADIEFEPVGETTGTLENGQLTTNSKLNIKVPEANVVIWGHELKIGGGTECQTREPAEITLKNQGDSFQPLDGGVVEGVYDLPELENCGLLTRVLNKFMSGPDNPIELELTPQNNE